ncbi:unnamed protein product [Rhizophagus irregularis]|nr:unnamed protein product [Rhizophagus irregularis]
MNVTSEFLREIESHTMIISDWQCWDAEPSKRPKAGELYGLLHNLYDKLHDDSEIKKQVEEAERINEKFTSTSLPYNEPKNAIDNKDDNNSIGEYSESIEAIDFTKLNLDKDN